MMESKIMRKKLITEVSEISKDIKEEHPHFTKEQCFDFAIQLQRNSLIKEAFSIDMKASTDTPTVLEKIVDAIEGNNI